MTMKITIEVSDPGMAQTILSMIVEDQMHGVSAITPVIETLGAKAAESAAVTSVAETSSTIVTAEMVRAGLSMKPTKAVTLADGAAATPGDEVLNGAGELGVIHTTFRGNALVEFEDGSAELIKSGELTLAAQNDEDPPAENLDAHKDAQDAARNALNGQITENVEILTLMSDPDQAQGLKDLKDLANGLVTDKIATPDQVFGLLAEYGAKKFDELTYKNAVKVDQALKALRAAGKTEEGFGF